MGRATNVNVESRGLVAAWFATTTRGFGTVVLVAGREEEDPIAASDERELGKAVECLEASCSPPPIKVYLSLLKSCRNHNSLHCVKRIYAHLAHHHRHHLNGLLGENLVITLVKCGDIDTALHIFYKLPHRTTFSWTAIISGLVDNSRSRDALLMYFYMQEEGIEPDHYTFVSLLKACGCMSDLIEGQRIHDKVREKGLTSDVFIGTTLISMYGKCGALKEAENVWLELPFRNIVTWNSMLSAYVEQGQAIKALCLYLQILEEGTVLDPQTLLIGLQACNTLVGKEETKSDKNNIEIALEIGRALHSNVRSRTLMKDVYIGNTLVSLYGKCDSIAEGENVFAGFSQLDVVSWTSLITMYVEADQGKRALQSYKQMLRENVHPNQQTFVSALQACCILAEEGAFSGHLMCLEIGQALHQDAQRMFGDLDAFVGTTLMGLYAKCGAMVEAEWVFSSLTLYTIVQWNGMLSAYVEHGQGRKALQCYRQLQEEGMCPDHCTFVIAFKACNSLLEETKVTSPIEEQEARIRGVHEIGQALHADARKAGFASDVVVGTSLVAMYGKCGRVEEAETVFSGLSQDNIVTWNAMLSAYVDQAEGAKALYLCTFLLSLFAPNLVTLICVLQACSESGCFDVSQHLHFIAVAAGHDAQEFLASTLIHAYGNCASIVDARTVFNGLTTPLIASWNACFCGYAAEGDTVGTWHLFKELHLTCIKPTESTFTSLLVACSHGGAVDKGILTFESMSVDFALKPVVKQYLSLLDLLGRSGNLSLAEKTVSKFPVQHDLSVWLRLIGACCAHSNLRLGKVAFDHAVSLQPMEAAPYVLMANVYGCTELHLALSAA